MNGEIRLDGRLLQLRPVDVDDHLIRGAREVLPRVADLPDVEPAADDENEVGVLNGEVPGPVADRSRTAGEEPMVARDDVVCVESRHERNAKALGEADEVAHG